MSTGNITSIEPVSGGIASAIGAITFGEIGEAIPSGVRVTFKTHGGSGTAVYEYSDPVAVAAILAGDDPANYSGVRV